MFKLQNSWLHFHVWNEGVHLDPRIPTHEPPPLINLDYTLFFGSSTQVGNSHNVASNEGEKALVKASPQQGRGLIHSNWIPLYAFGMFDAISESTSIILLSVFTYVKY